MKDRTDNAEQRTNAQRFFDAFKRVEHTLRSRLEEATSETEYGELIDDAAQAGFVSVKTYNDRLQTFANLRHAIAHYPDDGEREVIADPRDSVVEDIEAIADNVETPPTVEEVCVEDVTDVVGNEFVADVARRMKEADYSQAPVVDYEGHFRTLLTTNTIARWFAEASENDEEMREAEVDDVLDYREREDACEILGPQDNLFKVLTIFETTEEGRPPPYAIVVTAGGRENGEIEGILTPFDLPQVYDTLHLSRRH
jgi:predicted transcriptional regulator